MTSYEIARCVLTGDLSEHVPQPQDSDQIEIYDMESLDGSRLVVFEKRVPETKEGEYTRVVSMDSQTGKVIGNCICNGFAFNNCTLFQQNDYEWAHFNVKWMTPLTKDLRCYDMLWTFFNLTTGESHTIARAGSTILRPIMDNDISPDGRTVVMREMGSDIHTFVDISDMRHGCKVLGKIRLGSVIRGWSFYWNEWNVFVCKCEEEFSTRFRKWIGVSISSRITLQQRTEIIKDRLKGECIQRVDLYNIYIVVKDGKLIQTRVLTPLYTLMLEGSDEEYAIVHRRMDELQNGDYGIIK